MRQLRGDVDAAMASGRHGTLLVQRVWLVLQDERAEQATHQAETSAGEYHTTGLFIAVGN
jgi:PPE-repeat protein